MNHSMLKTLRNAVLASFAALPLAACTDGLLDSEDPADSGEETSETQSELAKLTLNAGFESGTLSPFLTNLSGGTITPVTSRAASGRYAAKFDLRRSSPTNLAENHFRAELHLQNPSGSFAFGKEYWLAMDYMYENWDTDKSAEIAPLDLHRSPSSWDPKCGGERSAFNVSPFIMMSSNNSAKFITYGGKTMWSGPIEKRRWLNIVVHFKITSTSAGFVEAWKDGVKIGRVDGALTSALDDCGKPWKPPFLNVQLYKWDWAARNTVNRSSTTVRTMYVDNVRIAEGPDGYGLIPTSTTSGGL